MNSENSTLKFKTNIKCGGCIAAVTPFINQIDNIDSWEVDTVNPDKVLTVIAKENSQQKIIDKIKQAGYKIEPLSNS